MAIGRARVQPPPEDPGAQEAGLQLSACRARMDQIDSSVVEALRTMAARPHRDRAVTDVLLDVFGTLRGIRCTEAER